MKKLNYGVYFGKFDPITTKEMEDMMELQTENKLDGIMFVPYPSLGRIADSDRNILLHIAFREFVNYKKQDLAFMADDISRFRNPTINGVMHELLEKNRECKDKVNISVSYTPILTEDIKEECTQLESILYDDRILKPFKDTVSWAINSKAGVHTEVMLPSAMDFFRICKLGTFGGTIDE